MAEERAAQQTPQRQTSIPESASQEQIYANDLRKVDFLIEMHLGGSEINNSKGYSDKSKQESGAITQLSGQTPRSCALSPGSFRMVVLKGVVPASVAVSEPFRCSKRSHGVRVITQMPRAFFSLTLPQV